MVLRPILEIVGIIGIITRMFAVPCTTFLQLMSYFEEIPTLASAIENTNRLDSQLLKQLSRMYENGISIRDISQELRIDEPATKKLLKMLGYVAAD